MAETEKSKPVADTEVLTPPGGPLVFISHDGRDAELAEAFGKLLKSVSAGMIRTFRSSDKKGPEGIDFGEEWFKRLMSKLQSTSDVVCLFTERSLNRPWILFEAGVAKGKLDVPVVGVALGIPLGRVSTGPFYQFQNMDDSEVDLTKLVKQLARRAQGVELDEDVVKLQVNAFKTTEAEILKKLSTPAGRKASEDQTEDNPVAKLVEEMKALPSRVAERLAVAKEPPSRRRRIRNLHPRMLEQMLDMAGAPGDPVGILMFACLFRDEAPWLYELAMEVYRAFKSGDPAAIESELSRLQRFSEFAARDPFMEGLGLDPESYMLLRDLPRMLRHTLVRMQEEKKTYSRRRTQGPHSEKT